MDKYKVKVNPRAICELDRIYEYIANEKLDPENAKGQVGYLSSFPPRVKRRQICRKGLPTITD